MQRRARKTCRSGARGEVGVRGGAVTNGLKATRDKKRGGGGGLGNVTQCLRFTLSDEVCCLVRTALFLRSP